MQGQQEASQTHLTAISARRLLVFIVLMAIWPYLHFWLVERLALTPWKFGGWAMYTVPPRAGRLRVEVVRQDQAVDLTQQVMRHWRREAEAYRDARVLWGKLYDGSDFALRLACATGAEIIDLTILRPHLDGSTGMYSEKADRYRFSLDVEHRVERCLGQE